VPTLVLSLTLLVAPQSAAQTAYTAANGPTTLVPRGTGFAQADFAEARLSLTLVHEFRSPRLGVAPYVGAAVRAGETDLFGSFNFNPGYQVGAMGFVRLSDEEATGGVVSLAVGYASAQRRVVEFNADSSVGTLSEHMQRNLAVAVGLNAPLGSRVLAGVGGSVRREWESPGVTRATELCVPGRDPTTGIIAPVCENRYVVALGDYWAGQVRGDLLWNAVRLGRSTVQPYLAVFGSGSVDLGQEASARLNLGTGLGVVPAKYPGHLLVALFVELYDLTDANGEAPHLADRLVTRITLGIPFAMVLR